MRGTEGFYRSGKQIKWNILRSRKTVVNMFLKALTGWHLSEELGFDTQAGIILILDSFLGVSHLSAPHTLRYSRAESENCISYHRALSWV